MGLGKQGGHGAAVAGGDVALGLLRRSLRHSCRLLLLLELLLLQAALLLAKLGSAVLEPDLADVDMGHEGQYFKRLCPIVILNDMSLSVQCDIWQIATKWTRLDGGS